MNSSDIVTEYCSTCETEITLRWNPRKDGYMIYCPSCGERLMLCDECQRRNSGNVFAGDCDYDCNTDSCRFNNAGYYVFHILRNGNAFPVKMDQKEPPAELLKTLVGGAICALPSKYGMLIVDFANTLNWMYKPPKNAKATSMLRSDIHDYVGGNAVLVQAEDGRLTGFSLEEMQRIMGSLNQKEGDET